MKSIAIIGGGASAVLLSMQVLKQSSHAQVTIFDPAPLATGIAYGTDHEGHLLNVPAARMSAHPDLPEHFLTWLHDRMPEATARTFAPRRIYRDYLHSLVAPWLGGRLRHVPLAVEALAETPEGVILTAGGQMFHHDMAVLATGNGAGPLAATGLTYWTNPTGFALPPDAPVLILGNGLSMVDSVISLLDGGHCGPITTLSRNGLTPRPHASVDAELPLALPPNLRLATLTAWFRQLRREGRHDWRQPMEWLRPQTQAIWLGFSDAEKRRFLRHGRALWDVHRHRMPPEAYARIADAQASGQLRILAGRLVADRSDRGEVEIRLRGNGLRTLPARHVIDCRGQRGAGGMADNPLLAGLVESGLARPGFQNMGLAVAANCALTGADGAESARLYAIGPLTMGRFWEIIAIPDIRLQARDLAAILLRRSRPLVTASIPGSR